MHKICTCNSSAKIERIHERKIFRQCWGSMLYYGDDYHFECSKCNNRTQSERVLTKVGEYYQQSWWKRIFQKIPENPI